MLVLCGTILVSVVGCGTTSGNGANGSSTTIAPGTYQVTVTAAASGANAVSHSTVISLTIS
jgi:hypothetical protein